MGIFRAQERQYRRHEQKLHYEDIREGKAEEGIGETRKYMCEENDRGVFKLCRFLRTYIFLSLQYPLQQFLLSLPLFFSKATLHLKSQVVQTQMRSHHNFNLKAHRTSSWRVLLNCVCITIILCLPFSQWTFRA